MIATGASISEPSISPLVTIFQDAATFADRYKIEKLLRGLASGLNQEKQINQL